MEEWYARCQTSFPAALTETALTTHTHFPYRTHHGGPSDIEIQLLLCAPASNYDNASQCCKTNTQASDGGKADHNRSWVASQIR